MNREIRAALFLHFPYFAPRDSTTNMHIMAAGRSPYDDATQLALARQDALIAAANVAVRWAREQVSRRPPRRTAAPEALPVEQSAASSFSISPLIDAARNAGDASLTAARSARSASRVAMNAMTAATTGVQQIAMPIVRVAPRSAAGAVGGVAIWFGVVKARPYIEKWRQTPPITRTVPAVTQADLAPAEVAPGSSKRTGRLVVTSMTDVA